MDGQAFHVLNRANGRPKFFPGTMLFGSGFPYAQSGEETTALTLENPFEPRGVVEWDAVEWAEMITSVLGVLILVVVLLTMFFGKRLPPPMTNFLRFVGLLALPVFLLLFGSFATFERSKKVEFCQSCHTAMDLYVNDMKNGESDTLAALHYKNRYIRGAECYNCHVNYGVFGAIQAKLTGLKHLYYWVTHSPTAIGQEQIKLYGAYQNDLCLRCHAGSRAFLEADDGAHVDMQEGLLEKDENGEPIIPCLDCHGPAHPSLDSQKRIQKGA